MTIKFVIDTLIANILILYFNWHKFYVKVDRLSVQFQMTRGEWLWQSWHLLLMVVQMSIWIWLVSTWLTLLRFIVSYLMFEWSMKNGSDRFSNFTSPGSADSVPDPVVTYGDMVSCSDQPPKDTLRPLCSSYTGIQDVALWVTLASIIITNPWLLHYVCIPDIMLTSEAWSRMAWPSMNK